MRSTLISSHSTPPPKARPSASVVSKRSVASPVTRRFLTGAVIAAACLFTALPRLDASAILPGFNSFDLVPNDDESSGATSLGFSQPINFYGASYSSLFVNNNGNVTFNGALNAYTPFGLGGTAIPIIAPFFGDVDTTGFGSNVVTFGTGIVDGREAFGANWVDVGYYSRGTEKLNSFQLVLVNRADLGAGDFDILFHYDKIQWETGSASGGIDGLGGSSAGAGFANGAGSFFEMAGSGVNGAFLDSNPDGLAHGSNMGSAGTYLFQVRNGDVQTANVVIPEPPQPPGIAPGTINPTGATPIPEAGNLLAGLACLAVIGLSRQRSLAGC